MPIDENPLKIFIFKINDPENIFLNSFIDSLGHATLGQTFPKSVPKSRPRVGPRVDSIGDGCIFGPLLGTIFIRNIQFIIFLLEKVPKSGPKIQASPIDLTLGPTLGATLGSTLGRGSPKSALPPLRKESFNR